MTGKARTQMLNIRSKYKEQLFVALAAAYSPTSSPMQYHLRSRA